MIQIIDEYVDSSRLDEANSNGSSSGSSSRSGSSSTTARDAKDVRDMKEWKEKMDKKQGQMSNTVAPSSSSVATSKPTSLGDDAEEVEVEDDYVDEDGDMSDEEDEEDYERTSEQELLEMVRNTV